MKVIVIEPTEINLKTLKFDHITKMLEGMLLTVLNINDNYFKRDIRLFLEEKEEKPPKNIMPVLITAYHMRLAVDELNRRTCGDYVKAMNKDGTMYKLLFRDYIFKKLNDKQVSVELTNESFSNTRKHYGRKK